MDRQMDRRAAVVTNNIECDRNTQFWTTVERYLLLNGWEVTESFINVSKVFIVGCGFTRFMYDKIKDTLRNIRKAGLDDTQIAIYGCTPKTQENELVADFQGLVVPMHAEHLLDSFIGAEIPFHKVPLVNVFDIHEQNTRFPLEAFHIKIAEGCQRQCTYCIINRAKGDLHSYPSEQIEADFARGVSSGYHTFVLTAEDTFAYGIERPGYPTIINLIERLLVIDPKATFLFGNFNVKWLPKYAPNLVEYAVRGVIKKIILGLQHTNDTILQRMGRPVAFAEVFKILCEIKKQAPTMFFSADIIVGFPGETEEIFSKLLEFFKTDTVFDEITHYGYSPNPGTPAERLFGQLTRAEILQRWLKLKEVLGTRSPYVQAEGKADNMKLLETSYLFAKKSFVDL